MKAMVDDRKEITKKTAWYEEFELEDLKQIIRNSILSASRSFIEIGYYLKNIRDRQLYLEGGYQTVWEFAQEEYGISKSTASRYMAMNDRFSQGGNSPFVADAYKNFDKSKLQEMLYLTESQREQVTPDMKVQEIRELRRVKEVPYYPIEGQLDLMTDFPDIFSTEENTKKETPEFLMDLSEIMEEDVATVATGEMTEGELLQDSSPSRLPQVGQCIRAEWGTSQEQQDDPDMAESFPVPLSAHGTPRKIYPEGSLIASVGCESNPGGPKGGYDCFSCARECGIRQMDRYCVDAPLGGPYPCEMMDAVAKLLEAMGDKCQFVNLDLAYHRTGDGEPVPCCKECTEPCPFRCGQEKGEIPGEAGPGRTPAASEGPGGVPGEMKAYDRGVLEKMIAEAEHVMEVMGDGWQLAGSEYYTQTAMEIQAYKNLMAEHDAEETGGPARAEEPGQPDLPNFRNDDQRKAWIEDYKAWGLWYRDEHIDVNYYKFDFDNGTRLVATEFPEREWNWGDRKSDLVFYHLIEKGKKKFDSILTYDDKYQYHSTSETEIVKYLKKIQQKKKGVKDDTADTEG